MEKTRVGILGATGAVGQNYARLLENHPWFEISYVAASPASAGKPYAEAVAKKWFMDSPIPKRLESLVVGDANKVEQALGKCDFVFSSVDGNKDEIKALEDAYAKAGFGVVSNNSAHRWTDDVPMVIPEINSQHLNLINVQKKERNSKGYIVVKPNCSIQSFLTPIHALIREGYNVNRMVVFTEQAASGAGYPGVPSLDLIDNTVPFISGEDEKTEREPLKILGNYQFGDKSITNSNISISSTCTRVPVKDGHTAIVNFSILGRKPELDSIIQIWNEFKAEPQRLFLPTAPEHPIIYLREENRPQPRKDRDSEGGMAVTVGRLRECNVLGFKFVGLSHNTIRGAAGGAILTAEYLKYNGLL